MAGHGTDPISHSESALKQLSINEADEGCGFN